MSRTGIAGLFSINRSVTNVGEESRPFRLPTMNAFPKLDRQAMRQSAVSQPLRAHEAVLLGGQAGGLPEMTSDLLDVDAGYAIENVRRERTGGRPWSRGSLGQLMGRMLGNAQAVTRL